MNTDTPYGFLLTFDGYGASASACGDETTLYNLLDTFPAHIGMRPLGHPHIISVQEPGIAGLSGFRFIMESHISIHTYQERGFITADIYSCKPFDTEVGITLLAEAFHTKSYETHLIKRGIRFHELSIPS